MSIEETIRRNHRIRMAVLNGDYGAIGREIDGIIARDSAEPDEEVGGPEAGDDGSGPAVVNEEPEQ